jgi:hypothetical protein
MPDVISENATDAVLSALDRGDADDRTRDRVSAALLRAVTKVIEQQDEMKVMIEELRMAQVRPEQVKELAAAEHEHRCFECPARQWVDRQMRAERKKDGWLSALVSSETLRYFVLVVLLVWAVVYLKTGQSGVDAVKGGVTHTLTGGLR